MNLVTAVAIVALIYLFLHWFIIPLPKKKRGKVVKMKNDLDDSETFYHK